MDRIVTQRMVLRRAREHDLTAMHAVLSHRVAMRYWSSLPHQSLDETRIWLDKMMATDPAISEDFVIERDGQVIGKVGAYRLPEIGYILHPDHWGQGLATEALTALIAHIWRSHPIDALTADVDPRNAGSLRLLEKLGFTVTGHGERTWHIGEEWCDSVYLTLQRPDHMTE
jgi:RimJ/RimL family protein N-acetyltransferase